DGEKLGVAPLKIELPRDDADHTLVIEAEGYDKLERTIRLDKSLALELALKRSVVFYGRPPPPPRADDKPEPPEPPPPPPSTPTSVLDKKNKGTKARQIDDDNPYK